MTGWGRAGVCLALAAIAAALFALTGRTTSLAASAGPGLAYSTDSNYVVQRQPGPDSCHEIGSGLYSRPDPRCTPGALNPQVRQTTIGQTICRRGWTATVRPPESITEREKRASLAAYGDRRPIGDYEYDHFVALELGGATNDPRNLWPEPGPSPNPKDTVEDDLNRKVCDGQISLAKAQREIAADWVALARARTKTTAPGSHATCSASAQYSSRYDDYDVYVHSNQPDQTVTVSGDGKTATWHTDSSGYADVFFYASSSAAGDQVIVRVGAATCSTRL